MNAFKFCARKERKMMIREEKRKKECIKKITSFSKYVKFGLLFGTYRVKSSPPSRNTLYGLVVLN